MKKHLIIILILLIMLPSNVFGASQNLALDLTVDPQRVLFDIRNLKPGDSVSRNLLIKNNGFQEFNYIASSKFLSGSEIFYNQLDLRVEDAKGVIYEGKLNKFIKLVPRLLKSKQNETLLFHVQIPMELGNEYQGVNTKFQIKLFVEGTLGGILPADGPRLPTTGTDMFNILIVGSIIVLGGGTSYLNERRKKTTILKR